MKMTLQEILEYIEKLEDNISCWNGLEDEVLKLYCLMNCCVGTVEKEGEKYINRNYVTEKIGKLCCRSPIILDRAAQSMFILLKIKEKENENN